ncbi:hypothetical protein G9A89_022490 [Geosiphon pyriformis]|nr:hypothetical protein G9A89_022490 [Geosiphon pyriformis]
MPKAKTAKKTATGEYFSYFQRFFDHKKVFPKTPSKSYIAISVSFFKSVNEFVFQSEQVAKAHNATVRMLSPYNAFMKSELPKVKAENPNLEHKAAFKLVAERWKNSPDNPKVYFFSLCPQLLILKGL